MSTFEEQVLSLLKLCNQSMLEVHELLHYSLELLNNLPSTSSSKADSVPHQEALLEECNSIRKTAVKVCSIYEAVKGAYLTVTTLSNKDPALIEQLSKTFENYCKILKEMQKSIVIQKQSLSQLATV